jgi:putative transposase
LKEQGIEPALQRKRQTTWHTFLKAHGDVLAAVDFTTVEIWSTKGLVTVYLLVVMELATRRVHFAGTTVSPEEFWMNQMARNLTGADDGFLLGKRYLLMNRDTKFSEGFAIFSGTPESRRFACLRIRPISMLIWRDFGGVSAKSVWTG